LYSENFNHFCIYSHADLKKYQYRYYVAFACLFPKIPFEFTELPLKFGPISLDSKESIYIMDGNSIAIYTDSATISSTSIFVFNNQSRSHMFPWYLRNFLVHLQKKLFGKAIQLLSCRDNGTTTLFSITFPEKMPQPLDFGITGWELDDSGKLLGRILDLKDHLDPPQYLKILQSSSRYKISILFVAWPKHPLI
jgi:Ubiquitin-like modifier-activating enzyme ATG7 N-terminus